MNLIQKDKEARLQALNANQSFIVEAPAGSGKTELLIQRFLTLLIKVNKPEEILAITFTKKAANEMRFRVLKALKQAQFASEPISSHAKQTYFLAKKVLAHDQELGWQLIENPNQLRIQTIDALCTYLTKQLPLLSHFGAAPNITTDPLPLYNQAVAEVLSHVEENFSWSNAISELLLHLDNDLNRLHDLLIHLLAKRDQWMPYLSLDANHDVKVKLESYLKLIVVEHLQKVLKHFPHALLEELLPILRFAADNIAPSEIESDFLAARDINSLPKADTNQITIWRAIRKVLLTKSGSWRKRVDADCGFPALTHLNTSEKNIHQKFRASLTKIIQSLSEQEELRQALHEILYLPPLEYDDHQWGILKALLQVLKITAAQLRVIFKQHGQIDFIENVQGALIALEHDQHPTDLALALDYQIKHILIDEFQDTSLTQYQLINKLISGWEQDDGRTLFIVGDPMQSIYRFREAEVGLFIRMFQKGIGPLKLTPISLAINFRSTAAIIEWNNKHFSKIFPSFSDMSRGAVHYHPSTAPEHTQTNNELSVVIKGFHKSTSNTEAHEIAAFIKNIEHEFPHDTIALLVRSRAHLNTIIPVLKKANIKYKAVDIDLLSSRQHIQDILSLTSALLHPADRLSWLAILRAPWCGLTLADLLIVAGNAHHAIWEQLLNPKLISMLSNDGQLRIHKIIPILKKKISERDYGTLRSWIEDTWLLLGGPATLSEFSDVDDINDYFQLLDQLSLQQSFINIDFLKEQINKLYASSKADAKLQIMTIHAAKGLEFDTVILPQLNKKPPNNEKALMQWIEQPLSHETALFISPIHAVGTQQNALYEFIHRQENSKGDFEKDRLFYVATTRAKKRLHLTFTCSRHSETLMEKIEPGSFLEKLWPFIKNNKHEIIAMENNSPLTETSTIAPQKPIKRLTSTWVNPYQDPEPITHALHQKPPGFVLANNNAKFMGIMIHKMLQLIAQLGVNWWTSQNYDKQISYLTYQCQQLGIISKDIPLVIETTLKAVERMLQDERGKWILSPHNDARSEYAMTALIENKPVNLIIDRTFVDENGIRWIIDYKTTTFTADDLEAFLLHEHEKYLEQMQKYFQAMQLVDDKPIKLGLYFPLLPAWREWVF